MTSFNTHCPKQIGQHFADEKFKCIFLSEIVLISIKISQKFVTRDPKHNNWALVQFIVWHWPCNKPITEPMMVRLLTHICVIWPQWVKLSSASHVCMRDPNMAFKMPVDVSECKSVGPSASTLLNDENRASTHKMSLAIYDTILPLLTAFKMADVILIIHNTSNVILITTLIWSDII